MTLFLKCIIVFVVLASLFTVLAQLLINLSPLPITILLSAMLSLLLTVLYGWIDGVYIHPSAG
jgi:hypothetical protein